MAEPQNNWYGPPATPVCTKMDWQEYRSGITAADTTPVGLSSAAYLTANYHHSSCKDKNPMLTPLARLHIRALTDVKATIQGYVYFFGPGGKPGRKYPTLITLTGTDEREGPGSAGKYLTEVSDPIEADADIEAHFVVTSLGGASSVDIQYRYDN